MNQTVNFSAGPAMLPQAVLQDIQREFIDWYHGISILEISHRSEPVLALKKDYETRLNALLNVPDDFTLLSMHGGARAQFCAVPMNLLKHKKASYLISGYWGETAAKACEKYAAVERILLENHHDDLSHLPLSADSSYLHITDNETIQGVELPQVIQQNCPVVMDATSNILSRAIPWQHIDCVYASGQKNLGIAGCTYVWIRKDLLGHAMSLTPDILNFTTWHEADSLYNTPCVFAWYVTQKVVAWVEAMGGVAAMDQLAHERAQALYTYVDQSDLYSNDVPQVYRSRLNVPFQIHKHQEAFFQQAEEAGLYFLEGHRSVGGARASMYNAMPMAHVHRLIDFMKSFEQRMS